MLRREFLIDVSILAAHKALYPATFQSKQETAKPDFRYKGVLKETFNEVIKEAKEKGTYKETEEGGKYVVKFDDKKAVVLDMNNNSQFDYRDFGFLNSFQKSNGGKLISYAEISLSTWEEVKVKTTDISVKFDTNFKKLVKERVENRKISEQDAIFSLLDKINRYSEYGMMKKLEGFDILSINRGEDIPLDPNNRVFNLYKAFTEHFGLDPRLNLKIPLTQRLKELK